jgi:hypothetical protein
VDPWTSIWLCIDHMPDLWGMVNRCSSIIVVVGRYPTIPLDMSIEIVYGPQQIAQRVVLRGKRALGKGGTRINPTISLRKVEIRGMSVGAYMSCWSGLYSCRVNY